MGRDAREKRAREKEVVSLMIRMYCRGRHGQKKGLCPGCRSLCDYAAQRIEHCPFMETKTFCSNCRVHCYAPKQREAIRQVMRYAGPRMLFHHPVMALRHLLDSRAEKKRLADADDMPPR